jgi:type VI secretion system protein ImpJ
MKITRPLWAKGVFMTPQHFQQQAMWNQFADDHIARMASPDAWGVIRVVFDQQALGINRLQLNTIDARLPDGSLIDSETADRLPTPRQLSDIPAQVDSAVVSIALPLLSAQGDNCLEEGERHARPRRFMREYMTIADINGEGSEEISVERHSLALLFDFETPDNYVTCAIGRVIRNTQGQFEIDSAFVPPCLFLSANDRLVERMKRISEILSAKSASLAVRRRERSDQIADYAVSDVSLFWLLHSVNSTWPDIARLCAAPNQHPERLYGVLARLAGSLLTFSTTETLQAIPAYDHKAPEPVFAELEALIRALLDTVIPSRVVPILLDHPKSTVWSGKINDERLADGADYYLAVQSSLSAHDLLEQLPRLCKVGAPDEVEQIVNSALPGIPLRAMSRLPAAIPVRIESQYFALDGSHPAFKRMIDARACQLYVPSSIPDVALELYAVLPT